MAFIFNNNIKQYTLIVCLIFSFFSYSSPLDAQNSWRFEHYSYLNSGLRQSFTIQAKQQLIGSLSFTGLVTVKNAMGGGNLGVEYEPFQWLTLGALGGYDIQLSSVSLMAYTGLKAGKTSFTAAYIRIGEVLTLYELAMMYNRKYWKAGAIARNYFGVGPRVDLKLPSLPAYVWVAGLYEWEKENYGLMLGLILNMKEKQK